MQNHNSKGYKTLEETKHKTIWKKYEYKEFKWGNKIEDRDKRGVSKRLCEVLIGRLFLQSSLALCPNVSFNFKLWQTFSIVVLQPRDRATRTFPPTEASPGVSVADGHQGCVQIYFTIIYVWFFCRGEKTAFTPPSAHEHDAVTYPRFAETYANDRAEPSHRLTDLVSLETLGPPWEFK